MYYTCSRYKIINTYNLCVVIEIAEALTINRTTNNAQAERGAKLSSEIYLEAQLLPAKLHILIC